MKFETVKDIAWGLFFLFICANAASELCEKFDLLSTSIVTVVTSADESNGKHWWGVFSEDMTKEERTAYFSAAIKSGKETSINRSLKVVDSGYVRGIVSRGKCVSLFAYWKGEKVENVSSKLISERSAAKGMEAVISVVHESGCALNFFASDYFQNKKRYKKEEDIQVNIVGFAYRLDEFNVEAINAKMNVPEVDINGKKIRPSFIESSCGYTPGRELDEISFFGTIQAVRKRMLGSIEGFIITVSITDQLSIDVFIASKNLTIKLVTGKQVCGMMFLQGSLW